MTQLSPNFTVTEFTRSEAAEAMGDANEPTEAHLANLKKTARGMEKVRTACGDRIVLVSSGYRNPAVNHAVGGVKNSDHAQGWACDFQVMGLSLVKAACMIVLAGIEFDQLIYEKSRGILHISFNPRARGQVLTQAGGPGTPVTKGIKE